MPAQHGPRRTLLITASVMLASLLYSIDWTIAAVALPHMQGAFSATQDQISWVITSYIVASAISLPTAGWLSTRFGRKRVFAWAMGIFTLASVACGAADTLAVEVTARVAQGLGGAFIIPLSHAIILDSYPPAEHGRAMALWGMGSVSGSFLGPTLGGYLTEYLNWRYIYYINLPLGLVALAGILASVPETARKPGHRLDIFGFLTLATGIGSLQLMLDRGSGLDWFESPEIVIEACLAVLGFYLFLAHSLTARTPFLDLRLVVQRNFALGLAFVFLYGLLTIPSLVLMPPFLQDIRGYSIESIGLLQAPRGVGMLMAMTVGGRITGRVDPRLIIAAGLLMIAIPAAEMSTWTADVGPVALTWTNFMQGVGCGVILVPIQIIAFPGVPVEKRTEATAVYNLVRSIGASIGVSSATSLFVRQTGIERAGLVEHVTQYRETLRYAGTAETWLPQGLERLAGIEHQIDLQAAMIAYIADFRVLAVAAVAGLPLLLLVRRQY